MKINDTVLICPICKNSLRQTDKQLSCNNKHSFDIAAKGYVNLLPVNQKRSKDPGDNKEMIDSRRNFLNKGYYQTFSDGINAAVVAGSFGSEAVILDAGCGEGYYLERLQNHLAAQKPQVEFSFWGVDISKAAVALACGRSKQQNFMVGSNYHLPFADSSLDCIIQIFAPGNLSEYHRVLKAGGRLITAEPGVEHLFELKELLYKEAVKNEERVPAEEILTLASSFEVRYQIEINSAEENRDLIAMTPYFWHVEKNLRSTIDTIAHLQTTLHFIIRSFVKS